MLKVPSYVFTSWKLNIYINSNLENTTFVLTSIAQISHKLDNPNQKRTEDTKDNLSREDVLITDGK